MSPDPLATSDPSAAADRESPQALTEGERRAWREDGFFVRRAVFSEAELAVLREAAERVARAAADAADAAREAAASRRDAEGAGGEARSARRYEYDGNVYVDIAGEVGEATVQYEHQPGSSTIRVIEPFHHLDPIFEALLDDPRIVEPIRGVIGSERVALWTDKLNLKRPREGSRFRWHQDSPYWTHACTHVDRLPNVMLALDDAHEGNGCFRIVPGSHAEGCLPGIQDDSDLGPLFTDPASFDESRQVLLEVPAGSLIFFSPHTVHGSLPNRSDEARRALILTYQPGDEPMFKMPGTRNVGEAAAID